MLGQDKKNIWIIMDSIILKTTKSVSWLSMVCLLIVALLATADAISSKIFSKSITNTTELVTYLNIPVVFLSMAYVQSDRGHTKVDLLCNNFPKMIQKFINVFSNLAGLIVCILLGKFAIDNTISKFTTNARSAMTSSAFAVWPFAAAVAIGFLLLAIAFFWCLAKEFVSENKFLLDDDKGD